MTHVPKVSQTIVALGNHTRVDGGKAKVSKANHADYRVVGATVFKQEGLFGD